jgi:hypothetical protein
MDAATTTLGPHGGAHMEPGQPGLARVQLMVGVDVINGLPGFAVGAWVIARKRE